MKITDFFPEWLIDPNAVDPQTARFIGFVLLNVSTLPHVRHQVNRGKKSGKKPSIDFFSARGASTPESAHVVAQPDRRRTFEGKCRPDYAQFGIRGW